MLQLMSKLTSGLVKCSSKHDHFLRRVQIFGMGVKVTGFKQLYWTLSCFMLNVFMFKNMIAILVL